MGLSHGYGELLSREESINLIHKAYNEGDTFFDTAKSHDAGHNEILVGEAIKPFRNNIVLAMKTHTLEGTHKGLGRLFENI